MWNYIVSSFYNCLISFCKCDKVSWGKSKAKKMRSSSFKKSIQLYLFIKSIDPYTYGTMFEGLHSFFEGHKPHSTFSPPPYPPHVLGWSEVWNSTLKDLSQQELAITNWTFHYIISINTKYMFTAIILDDKNKFTYQIFM